MAVFSVGILWHRANESGGLAGLYNMVCMVINV